MAGQENEETAELRPACVACTFRCNQIHGDRDLEEEKFDPDRSCPYFRKKMTKRSLVGVVHSDDVEVDNTLKHAGGAAHLESSVAMSLPKSSPQPQKIEDRTIVDCTDEQRLRAQSSSPHVKNFSMISPNNILHSAMEASQKSCTDIQGIIEDHSNAASNNLVFESCKIDSMAQAAADYEPVTRKGDAHANSSQVTLPTRTLAMPDMYESKLSTLNSMSKDIVKIATVNSSRLQGKVQEAGERSSETLDKTVNVPVTETTISQELAKELDTLKLNEEEFKSINTDHDECMFQSASSSVALKDCQLQVTKTKPEEVQSILPVSENSNENEIAPSTDGLASQTRNEEISTAMTSGFETPATEEIELQLKSGNVADIVMKQTALKEVMVGNPQRKLEFKELIANVSDPKVTPDAAQVEEKHFNIQAKPTLMIKPDDHICTLISRRGQVAQGERDRALHLAQALANSKHPKPCFVAVMKSTHVYTDFNMDIPADFVKQWTLPAKEVRVTLVSDEPPSNCKAIWKPGNDLKNATLNAHGWMNFSRTHFLEEGDVCVFEVLKTHPAFRIGVYIFRVVELKKPRVHHWELHYKVPETIPAGAKIHTTIQA